MAPIALVMSGPLADRVFIPMLSEGGMLASSVGRVIGVGKGRGIGLMLILMGLSVAIGTLVGYMYPRLRKVEFELPDAIADHNEAVVDLTPSLDTVEGTTPHKPTTKAALPVYSTPATDTKIA